MDQIAVVFRNTVSAPCNMPSLTSLHKKVIEVRVMEVRVVEVRVVEVRVIEVRVVDMQGCKLQVASCRLHGFSSPIPVSQTVPSDPLLEHKTPKLITRHRKNCQ